MNRYGPPTDTVQEFVKKLDSKREFLRDIFGLDFPAWSPDEPVSGVPMVERQAQGEKT